MPKRFFFTFFSNTKHKPYIILCLLIGSLLSSFGWAKTGEVYVVKANETLEKILLAKGFPKTPTKLLHYIDKTVELNPDAFVFGNPDFIEPGYQLQLPYNPLTRPVPIANPTIRILPQPIGSIDIKKGNIEVLHQQNIDFFAKENSVYEGDTVITDAAGVADITLLDQSVYTLGPNSQLSIDNFKFSTNRTTLNNQQPASTFIAKIKLLLGALTVKTGHIGKNANDIYELSTPLSTLGVRGTEYTARYCQGELCGALAGASVAVTEGAVEFGNAAAKVDLKINEFVQAKSAEKLSDVGPIPEGFLDLEADTSKIEVKRTWWNRITNSFNSVFF